MRSPDLNDSMQQSVQRKYLRDLLLHFRPSTVPERTLRLSLTWGLGGIALVLVVLLFGTGLLRNMHRWSGNGLLIVVKVDTAQPRKRSTFAAGQATYPDSP